MKLILVLSGQIASGKTTLSKDLVSGFGFKLVKTNELLLQRAGDKFEATRQALQTFGESQDRKTKGTWISEELARLSSIQKFNSDTLVVVDSVRIESQIQALRTAFSHRVVHIHLEAPELVLNQRFSDRTNSVFSEASSFAETQKNRTEQRVKKLSSIADVVIDTNRCRPRDVLIRVASHLGLFGRQYERLVDVMVGGQYGSEGKGHMAAYLSKEYDILVRVGGPNAGHTVYFPPYTFHHLPSGSAHNHTRLLIGPGAVLNLKTPKGKTKPKGLLEEILECGISQDRLSIDPQAMIIEPEDINNEKALESNIASTATGVGYATARRIIGRASYRKRISPMIRESVDNSGRMERVKVRLAQDIKELRPYISSTHEELERAYADGKRIFLEGTQGTGLSVYQGPYPHVTSRDTTVAGCLAEAGISPSRVRKVVMVCRTYPIRVGNTKKSSGPLVQEISFEEVSERSGIPLSELVSTEITSTTKRPRRVGEFDWSLLRQSATLNAPTDIALSFVDYIDIRNRDARRFDQLTDPTIRFIEEVEKVSSAPVSLISTRFHHRAIIDRRSW
jgi:adenylosuccinate synthase